MATMKTPRNNLEVNVMRGDTDMLEEIDAVYEICGAEFLNEQRIHAKVSGVIREERHPEPAIAEYLAGEVARIAKRDGLMAGSKPENFKSIAGQCAADINETLGNDIRREQRISRNADHAPSPY